MVIELEKIGIIDLGSNTARLLIMQIMEDGHFVVLDQLKETPRLGEGGSPCEKSEKFSG